ncbi:PREDICTED: probable protein phosphatase 2C 78 isoform X2 [Tarenaya hassleriana]|uniref:probable protein phosphatase 2C 78 isoform X2 n=1 Tax=Tarenaya hassleriana TaxID=28532 RepID=UPI00053C7C0A|nr:PREDICTED: probable protein phosphatase 2C 78 isoform X2 [Tarenaya hassleriana]
MLIKPDQRMAEICCGVLSENEAAAATVTQPSKSRRERSSSRAARRRRMEIRRIKFVSSMPSSEHTAGQDDGEQKRRRRDVATTAAVLCRVCEEEKCDHLESAKNGRTASETAKEVVVLCESLSPKIFALPDPEAYLKCGVVSVCGKRQDMEDAVAVHPFFLHPRTEYSTAGYHYCGVYDGHGCSHVAMRCRDRLHELVREELDEMDGDWEGAMERSFTRMDKEVVAWNEGEAVTANCRCELQTPDCDAVGSTAVVAVVTPDKIIVANCGDSRAVLCRSGKSIPLSSDHKVKRWLRAWNKSIRNSKSKTLATFCAHFVTLLALLAHMNSRIGRMSSTGSRPQVAESSTGTDHVYLESLQCHEPLATIT